MDSIENRLRHLLQEKAKELSAEIIEMEIMPDHVHVLVEIHPQFGIHKLVKRLKRYTSRILRKEYKTLRTRIPTLWTNSYCVLTTGGATIDILKKYIQNQKGV